jgi:hypothetical protein
MVAKSALLFGAWLETIIQKRRIAIMASAGVRGIRPADRVSC